MAARDLNAKLRRIGKPMCPTPMMPTFNDRLMAAIYRHAGGI